MANVNNTIHTFHYAQRVHLKLAQEVSPLLGTLNLKALAKR
jgi:hypothetical protein